MNPFAHLARMAYATAALCSLAFTVHPAHAAAPANDPNAVKIGFMCPFSGGSADFGTSARNGAQLAVDDINKAGGFLGRKVELIALDDKGDPDTGRANALELVNKHKVVATVAFCNTGVAMKALDVFQDNQSVLIVPVSTGTAVTAKYPPQNSFIFRMSARDALQAPFIVSEVLKRGAKRIAIFADKTGYGDGGVKDVTEALAKQNLQPAYIARFDLKVESLENEMKEARAAGVDAIIAYTVGPQAGLIAKARAAAGVRAPLFGAWPMSFPSARAVAGSAMEGAMMPQTIIEDAGNERRSSFILSYNRTYNTKSVPSLMAAAQSYDSVLVLFYAMMQTPFDLSGTNIKRSLENLQKTVFGVVSTYEKPFSSDDHDAFSSNMIWLGTVKGDRIAYVYAEDAKRSAIVRKKK